MAVSMPPEEISPGARRLARIAGFMLWIFAAGFAIGAVQVWTALRSDRIWADFRGRPLGREELVHTLVFMIVAAAALTLLAWRWQRALRRDRGAP